MKLNWKETVLVTLNGVIPFFLIFAAFLFVAVTIQMFIRGHILFSVISGILAAVVLYITLYRTPITGRKVFDSRPASFSSLRKTIEKNGAQALFFGTTHDLEQSTTWQHLLPEAKIFINNLFSVAIAAATSKGIAGSLAGNVATSGTAAIASSAILSGTKNFISLYFCAVRFLDGSEKIVMVDESQVSDTQNFLSQIGEKGALIENHYVHKSVFRKIVRMITLVAVAVLIFAVIVIVIGGTLLYANF